MRGDNDGDDDDGNGTISSLSSLSSIHGGGGQSGFWRRALKTFHKSADTTIKKLEHSKGEMASFRGETIR